MLKRVTSFIGVIVLAMPAIVHAADGIPDSCRLLNQAEIRNAMGGKVSGFKAPSTFRGGSSSLCQGRAGGAVLTIRVSEQSKQDDQNEGVIEQMISEGGGKVETVRTGAVACTTIVPAPAMAADYGYDSLCAISEGGREIAVQAATHDQAEIAPVAQLRRLVLIAAQRLNDHAH